MDIFEIVERMKKVSGLQNDPKVAEALGMTAGALKNHKSRRTIPFGPIVEYGVRENVSIDWLLTGEGPMERQAAAGKGTTYTRDSLREEIIDVLDEIFIKEDRRLPPRKMEELIQLLYEELSEEESEEVRKGKVLRFVRALAA